MVLSLLVTSFILIRSFGTSPEHASPIWRTDTTQSCMLSSILSSPSIFSAAAVAAPTSLGVNNVRSITCTFRMLIYDVKVIDLYVMSETECSLKILPGNVDGLCNFAKSKWAGFLRIKQVCSRPTMSSNTYGFHSSLWTNSLFCKISIYIFAV